MKKKIATLLTAVSVLSVAVIAAIVLTAPKMSEADKTSLAVDKAVRDLGFELSYSEKLYEPVVYSDDNGNKIVFNRFLCSDPERIKNGEVSYFSDVFNPNAADQTKELLVSDTEAILCEKDGRSYLLWYPNNYTILMLDYDPQMVSDGEILKMAESCS